MDELLNWPRPNIYRHGAHSAPAHLALRGIIYTCLFIYYYYHIYILLKEERELIARSTDSQQITTIIPAICVYLINFNIFFLSSRN